MPASILLYSTNTWLAYSVSESYYGGEHYVWCTPYFSPRSAPAYATIPPTSSPSTIYHSLADEVKAGDRHSSKIKENRIGIVNGAHSKRAAGTIDDLQEREIIEVVESAEARDFRPLLYVIPFHLVADRVVKVPIGEKAHPLSVEYMVERLPRNCFDVIDFER